MLVFTITGNSSPAYRRRETSCHKFVKMFNKIDKVNIIKEKAQAIYSILEKDVRSRLCIIGQKGNYILAPESVHDIKIISNNELINILSEIEE